MRYGIVSLLGVVLMGLLAMGAGTAELGKITDTLDGREVSVKETTLGNFVADALRDASGADIALLHAMAFRANALIDKGIVDEQAIRNAISLPSTQVVTLKLTPAQLRAVMLNAVKKVPESNMAFLQVSGMTVKFDSARPEATRVLEIQVGGKAIDFTDTKTTYTVAMPMQLAQGGAGYQGIFTDEVLKTITDTKLNVLQAIRKEFELHNGQVTPKLDNRLVDANPKKDK